MKTVYFIRHAKSSWKDMSLSDINRPLNGRGKRDAPFMASMSHQKEKKPDIIITSPAKRAYDTANHFRKAHHLKKGNLIRDPRLYMASTDGMLEVIKELPEDVEVVYIFAHNPGMTYTANYFSAEHIENVPTCGLFKVSSTALEWSLLNQENSQLEKFIFPKLFNP
jgi:phosphohistidine phosphatase